jgi:NADH-quinone oxidoreductase subunit C
MSDTETVDESAAVLSDPAREKVIEDLRRHLGEAVLDTHIRPGSDLWVRVGSEAWPEAAAVARFDLGFRFFCFLSAIDWMPSPFGRYLETEGDTLEKFREFEKPESFETGYAGGERRFQVLGRVMRLDDGLTINFKADIASDEDPQIGTWTATFGGADWHEREAWEMYGITFLGHPGLRHMYLPGHFEGHPMRKDFPLLARLVKPWPGIVDVEPMPGAADESSGEEA